MSYHTVSRPPSQVNNLKPPKHPRKVTPRVCATCRFAEWETFETADGRIEDSGMMGCTRPNGPKFDGGDMFQWFYTCDRWDDETNGGQA